MARLSATYRRPVRTRTRSWSGSFAVLVVLVGLFAAGIGLGQATGLSWPDLLARAGRSSGRAAAMPPSRPTQIAIPAIHVHAPVAPLGLAEDGTIAVPPLERHHETGWYKGGPTPGQDGPAIIVGHNDTRTGPSVFYDLRKLRPGDRVEISRVDRTIAVFEVDSVEHFDKNALPAKRVYGDFSHPGLRLITCGGQWVGGSIGYSDNVVVFASLVNRKKAGDRKKAVDGGESRT